MTEEKGNTTEINYPNARYAFNNCENDVFLVVDEMVSSLGDMCRVKITVEFYLDSEAEDE